MPRSRTLACAVCVLAFASACRRGASADGPVTGGDVRASGEGIPSSVFGGGTPVTFVAEGTVPVRIHLGFEKGSLADTDHAYVERWKVLPAGRHAFTVSIPAGISGGLDVTLKNPKPGDKASCVVTAGDLELTDAYTLEQPLEPGTAAFAQVNVDDWATLEASTD